MSEHDGDVVSAPRQALVRVYDYLCYLTASKCPDDVEMALAVIADALYGPAPLQPEGDSNG